MAFEHAQESIQRWIENIPKGLIELIYEGKTNLLQEYLQETLNLKLREEGFQAEIKLLSAGFNKVYSLTIKDLNQDLKKSSSGGSKDVDSIKLCVVFERLGDYIDPNAGQTLRAKNRELAQYIAPVYASAMTGKHRVSLLPYYNEGTLDKQTDYASYFPPASDKSLDADCYRLLTHLTTLHEQFFRQQHSSKGKLEKHHVSNFETLYHALEQYSTFLFKEKAKSLREEKKVDESITTHSKVPGHEQEYIKDIENYFQSLITQLNFILGDHPQRQHLMRELLGKIPDKQSGNYLEKTYKAVNECEKIVNRLIGDIHFDNKLDQVISAQQRNLLGCSLKLLDLFEVLEKNNIQYFDIKSPNFIVNKDKLVIVDTKTLVERNGPTVRWGNGHMTFQTPQAEFEKLSSSGSRVSSESSKALTKYQLGLALYEMTLGITHHYNQTQTPQLIDAGLKKELDFNFPSFKTEIGRLMAVQIKELTQLDPSLRPDVSEVKGHFVGISKMIEAVPDSSLSRPNR